MEGSSVMTKGVIFTMNRC